MLLAWIEYKMNRIPGMLLPCCPLVTCIYAPRRIPPVLSDDDDDGDGIGTQRSIYSNATTGDARTNPAAGHLGQHSSTSSKKFIMSVIYIAFGSFCFCFFVVPLLFVLEFFFSFYMFITLCIIHLRVYCAQSQFT